MSGNSQAVRLPKRYRFSGDEVAIKRLGNAVVLLPKEDPWQVMFDALQEFPEDLQIEAFAPGILLLTILITSGILTFGLIKNARRAGEGEQDQEKIIPATVEKESSQQH